MPIASDSWSSGHDHRGLLGLVIHQHLTHARGRERLRDEPGGLLVVGDDVDLLAAQLGHDHAHARATRAHAGADRVDAAGVRDDGDLRAVAGLARDVLDLDQLVGDLRHFEFEKLPDQLGRAARDDDARALRLVRDVGDDRLDPGAVLVALVVDLLGLGQQRLDALAQLHERVARVGLLDDAGDQLADAVLVLVEHHVALGLADPLEDHLLGGLRGDAAEVVRRDVALVDLLGVLGEQLLVELGLFGLAHLPRLGVDGRLLDLDLGKQLLLELGRDQQLEDLEVRGLAVHVDARVMGGARLLLVSRQQRVLQSQHQPLGGDALLALEDVDCLDDLLRHKAQPSSRLLRLMSE